MISFMKKKIFGKKKDKPKKEAKHIRVIRLGLWKLAKRFRLRERIDLANKWADKHRGRTAGFTLGALLFSLLLGVLMNIYESRKEEGEPSLNSIALISPMFDGMHRIQQVKAYQVEQIEQMTLRGKAIKHELDSLVRIPVKSHDDSLQIVVKFRQLEMIVSQLENNRK